MALPDLSGTTLRTLEIFVSVAQGGSMSAAAERLGISQPAVSQAVRSLEEALGQRLLDRSSRPAALTLAGNTVLHHATAMIGHKQAIERGVRAADGTVLPILRIGMANSLAVTVGPLLIERLRHLALRWSVASGPDSTKISGLTERRVDVVISFDDTLTGADFLTLPIFSEPYFLAIPADWDGEVESLQALAERREMLWYGTHLHVSRQIAAYLERERIAVPQRYRFDTIDAVIAMVAAGLGWALVTPLSYLKSANFAPRIRCLPLPGAPLRRELVLATRPEEGGTLAPLIRRAAVDLLRDNVLPEIRRLIPHIAGTIRLASVGGREGAE